MDDNSTMKSLQLSIIGQNENFSSAIIESPEFTDKVMTIDEEKQEENMKEQEENVPQSLNKNSFSSFLTQDYEKMQSLQLTISTIVDNLITQIDSNTNISSNSSEEQDLTNEEKQDDLKVTKRTLRSRVRGKSNMSMPYQIPNDNRRVSNRRRASEKILPSEIYEKLPRKKTTSERSNNETIEQNDGKNFL